MPDKKTNIKQQMAPSQLAHNHFVRPTPAESATALISVVFKANSDRRVPVEGLPRGRLTRIAYLTCMRRNVIPEAFFSELQAELGIRGYAIIDLGDVVALIPASTVRKWVRIRSDKVTDIARSIEDGSFDFAAKDHEIKLALNQQNDATEADE